jgi:alkylation response protein AidB-like acyl-CoA dehydrogenase
VALLWLSPTVANVVAGQGIRQAQDIEITQIYEGTNQVQRVVMSRALLK